MFNDMMHWIVMNNNVDSGAQAQLLLMVLSHCLKKMMPSKVIDMKLLNLVCWWQYSKKFSKALAVSYGSYVHSWWDLSCCWKNVHTANMAYTVNVTSLISSLLKYHPNAILHVWRAIYFTVAMNLKAALQPTSSPGSSFFMLLFLFFILDSESVLYLCH